MFQERMISCIDVSQTPSLWSFINLSSRLISFQTVSDDRRVSRRGLQAALLNVTWPMTFNKGPLDQ